MAKKIVSEENWTIDYFNFLSIYCCPTVFSIFKTNKNMTYWQCFDYYLKLINLPLNRKEAKYTLHMLFYAHDLAVFRQNVCLLENMMKNSLIDLSSENFRTRLKEIREKTTISGGEDLTNYNFIKIIRNTFAHNNELEENPQLTFFENLKEGKIQFKIEKPEQGLKIVMSAEDMDSLCHAIVQNSKDYFIPESTLAVRTTRLRNALLGNYFDVEKINRYMQFVKNEDEMVDITLDEHQKQAIINYFNSGRTFNNDHCLVRRCYNKNIGISLSLSAAVNTAFPKQNNALSLATQNLLLINAVYGEVKKNPNVTFSDILAKFRSFANSDDEQAKDFSAMASYLLASPYSVFLETATALTTVLSNRDTQDFEEEYRAVFGDGTFHHVRNAMVHGTYFFDFKDNINIYDGQRKLKFITALDCAEVLAQTQTIARKRWHETFKIKHEENNENA